MERQGRWGIRDGQTATSMHTRTLYGISAHRQTDGHTKRDAHTEKETHAERDTSTSTSAAAEGFVALGASEECCCGCQRPAGAITGSASTRGAAAAIPSTAKEGEDKDNSGLAAGGARTRSLPFHKQSPRCSSLSPSPSPWSSNTNATPWNSDCTRQKGRHSRQRQTAVSTRHYGSVVRC